MADAIYCRNGHFNGLMPEPTHRGRVSPYREIGEEEYLRQLTRLAYCPKCGAENVFECPHCEATIEHEDVSSERPSYCSTCGKAFPWTESALMKVKAFTDQQDDLNADEKAVLKGVYDDLADGTPGKEVQASWFNGLLRKLRPDAAEVIRKTLIEIVSETTARLLRP